MSLDQDGIVKHSLWTTHMFQRGLSLTDAENEQLAQICLAHTEMSMESNGVNNFRVPSHSIYAYDSEVLQKYFKTVVEAAHHFLSLYGVQPHEVDLRFDGFSNIERTHQWATPHAHVNTDIVVTYYPRVFRAEGEHPRGGCLSYMSNDPKMSTWMLRRERQVIELRPETGVQFVFPGYINHSTTPLFADGSEKIALVTNVRVSDVRARGKRAFMTQAEIIGDD